MSTTTTSTACVNDFEERYNRLRISIIVACIIVFLRHFHNYIF